jgi:hypothetical protein
MANLNRPPLGFEYQIAVAKIDTGNVLSFAETPYPAIVGDFVVVACTRDMRCVPPVDQVKFIPCGYNPAANVIPAPTIPGTLYFSSQDKPLALLSETYGGALCVARLRSNLDQVDTVRTWYCSYWTPRFELNAPEGDGVGSFSGDGGFTLLSTA